MAMQLAASKMGPVSRLTATSSISTLVALAFGLWLLECLLGLPLWPLVVFAALTGLFVLLTPHIGNTKPLLKGRQGGRRAGALDPPSTAPTRSPFEALNAAPASNPPVEGELEGGKGTSKKKERRTKKAPQFESRQQLHVGAAVPACAEACVGAHGDDGMMGEQESFQLARGRKARPRVKQAACNESTTIFKAPQAAASLSTTAATRAPQKPPVAATRALAAEAMGLPPRTLPGRRWVLSPAPLAPTPPINVAVENPAPNKGATVNNLLAEKDWNFVTGGAYAETEAWAKEVCNPGTAEDDAAADAMAQAVAGAVAEATLASPLHAATKAEANEKTLLQLDCLAPLDLSLAMANEEDGRSGVQSPARLHDEGPPGLFFMNPPPGLGCPPPGLSLPPIEKDGEQDEPSPRRPPPPPLDVPPPPPPAENGSGAADPWYAPYPQPLIWDQRVLESQLLAAGEGEHEHATPIPPQIQAAGESEKMQPIPLNIEVDYMRLMELASRPDTCYSWVRGGFCVRGVDCIWRHPPLPRFRVMQVPRNTAHGRRAARRRFAAANAARARCAGRSDGYDAAGAGGDAFPAAGAGGGDAASAGNTHSFTVGDCSGAGGAAVAANWPELRDVYGDAASARRKKVKGGR